MSDNTEFLNDCTMLLLADVADALGVGEVSPDKWERAFELLRAVVAEVGPSVTAQVSP